MYEKREIYITEGGSSWYSQGPYIVTVRSRYEVEQDSLLAKYTGELQGNCYKMTVSSLSFPNYVVELG